MNTEFNKQDERFIARAKQLLDHRVEDLDTATTQRLQHARLQVLDARPDRRWWTVWAGGLAMAAIAVLSLSIWLTQPVHERHHPPLLDDIELITSVENIELAEDLEFYHWLADANTTG